MASEGPSINSKSNYFQQDIYLLQLFGFAIQACSQPLYHSLQIDIAPPQWCCWSL
jgi:hypothetical protein